jgi:DNA-directed RNA polymerase specialized sigma24 family protein
VQQLAENAVMSDACSERKQDSREPIAGPGICMTQQQIADSLGVTRARIHAIEKHAIWKMRKELKRMGLEWNDFYGK